VNPERPLTLGDVLANPAAFRDGWVFLPSTRYWSLDSPAVIVDLDDTDEDESEVERRLGMRCTLSLGQIEDLVTNARLQQPRVKPAQLILAFLYYWEHDAFIDFDAKPQ
jgi:hypothetical protein